MLQQSIIKGWRKQHRHNILAMLSMVKQMKSYMTFLIHSTLSTVLALLGHGIISSLFWRLLLAGSIGAAVAILIVGYTTNHFGLIVKRTAHIIFMS
jgi:hypothetical protein